jgi:hypothetical protein
VLNIVYYIGAPPSNPLVKPHLFFSTMVATIIKTQNIWHCNYNYIGAPVYTHLLLRPHFFLSIMMATSLKPKTLSIVILTTFVFFPAWWLPSSKPKTLGHNNSNYIRTPPLTYLLLKPHLFFFST